MALRGGRPAGASTEPAGRAARAERCRNRPPGDDGRIVAVPSVAAGDHGAALLALYDDAVGEVYGYLLARCRNRTIAEDVTSDVFMGAVDAVSKGGVETVTTAWLIGIARHKLVDHWRRVEREQRRLTAVADEPGGGRRGRPVGRPARRAGRPRRPRAARRPPPRPPSRCATSTGSASRSAPPCSTAPSTPPRPCSCGPSGRSAHVYEEEVRAMTDAFDQLRIADEPRRPRPALRRRPAQPPRRRPRRRRPAHRHPARRGAPP